MPGPLDGLLVIDASWGMPSSITSLLLADYGALVVKVERPGGGADATLPERKMWDRGKWSIELDPQDPADADTLRQLLRRADIFIESYGIGRSRELGLDHDDLRELNPRLIQLSTTGYGRSGPWQDRPGYEALVAARMGFMAEQPGHREGPIFLGHPSIGYTTGFLGAIGILAALRARRITGAGQRVDVSVLDGVLGQAPMNWWFTAKDESYLSTKEKGHFGHRRVLIDLFECGDGEYLMIHTGGNGAFKAAMEVLGVGEHFQDIPAGKVEMGVPMNEEEFQIARQEVPKIWKTRPRDEWLELLRARDVAVVPVLRPGEILEHEQVRHAGLVMEMPDEDYGTLHQVAPVLKFSTAQPDLPAPAPKVGQNQDQLDSLLAREPQAATPGEDLDHPLTGLRILDLSQFMAAAYGAKYLSDLGADVIKIEPPIGDTMRSLPDPFEACQRGKRAIVLDLTTAEGKEHFMRLLQTADVVVHNQRPGKAEKLGIDYESLRKVKPDLIYCYQPGWGADGPWAMEKSFAPLLSALTGLMYVASGSDNKPVRRARASEDYYGGFLGATGILMALEHRAHTGEGQFILAPQLHASLFAVSEHMTDGNHKPLDTARLDLRQLGLSPTYRLFETTDGWVCVAAVGERAQQRLREGLAAVDVDLGGLQSVEALGSAVETYLSTLDTTTATAWLDSHRIANEVARDTPFMPEFFWEEWAVESGHVFEHLEHADWGYIREVGLTVRLSQTPGRKSGPGPTLGQHTTEVLDSLQA